MRGMLRSGLSAVPGLLGGPVRGASTSRRESSRRAVDDSRKKCILPVLPRSIRASQQSIIAVNLVLSR